MPASRRLLALAERLGITSNSRSLQFASFNFDASVGEIAMAFAMGAALFWCRPKRGPVLAVLRC